MGGSSGFDSPTGASARYASRLEGSSPRNIRAINRAGADAPNVDARTGPGPSVIPHAPDLRCALAAALVLAQSVPLRGGRDRTTEPRLPARSGDDSGEPGTCIVRWPERPIAVNRENLFK